MVPAFERETGIKVNYDVFDSNEVIETKLLSGRTGYDVVAPSANFLQRQIQAGVFQKLDKSLLPNLKNADPAVMRLVDTNDPGAMYGILYLWGTSGVAWNEAKVQAAMPGAPVDSFHMLFDPTVLQHFAKCGVSFIDAPDEVVDAVLLYLGRNPASEAPEDLAAAAAVLMSIRPYIRFINSSKYIEDLANGEICLAFGWSGDAIQAKLRAEEAGTGQHIRYAIPKEGAMAFFDMLAIPADAPHPRNAHLFLNYLLRPDIAAKNSNLVHFANGNLASYPLLDPTNRNDGSIYPSDEQMKHLYPNAAHSLQYTRQLNRVWTRFKTGR